MFSVIYEFQIKPGEEAKFKEHWQNLTELIKKDRGGLGSCLNKDLKQENVWIAYARWPNKAAWETPAAPELTQHHLLAQELKSTCIAIKVLYTMEVIEDLLSPIREH